MTPGVLGVSELKQSISSSAPGGAGLAVGCSFPVGHLRAPQTPSPGIKNSGTALIGQVCSESRVTAVFST